MIEFLLNPIFLITVISVLFFYYLKKATNSPKMQRGDYIRQFEFPLVVSQNLLEVYPHLDESQTEKIVENLRTYLQICNLAEGYVDRLALPSKAVELAWQEFAANKELYGEFCQQAFGCFLEVQTAKGIKGQSEAQQAAIKHTFKRSCILFNITHSWPERLPPIFALDAELAIPEGFHYTLSSFQKRR